VVFETEQEKFWAGRFGDEYTDRNVGKQLLADVVQTRAIEFQRVSRPISSVIEFGANRGLNIEAIIRILNPEKIKAIEINSYAAAKLLDFGCEVENISIFEYDPIEAYELALVCGVLIHLNPDRLKEAYRIIGESSSKYVVISEYFNPTPAEVSYRGHANRLFKRDFAAEFLVENPEFKLADYGFHYANGAYAGDNQTWFLLQRTDK
jgi:pseudaminic acid biosynthesis-associated methylase